jgi:hypothetical protein
MSILIFQVMKSKAKPILYVFFLKAVLLFLPFYLNAQVTIGTVSEPQSGALLDLKEWDIINYSPDSANSKKGLSFPKVSLSEKESLFPLYTTTAEPQVNSAKGMVVYNVNSKIAGLNVGLCVWNGTEWSPIAGGGSDIAKMDINCTGKITVNGSIVKEELLSPASNSIILPVTVSQEGKYQVVAYSDPDNDYYFEATGEFLKKGNFDLILKGVGTPKYSTLDRKNTKDKIKIHMNGTAYDVATKCPSMTFPELEVEDIPVKYYFSCSQVNISGVKLNTTQSSQGSYITVRLQVSKASIGAKYHIQTNTSNGVKFEGNGTLYSEQQVITLEADGTTPTMAGIANFYFITNSSDSRLSNCSVEIPISGRTVNVVVMGVTGGAWDIGGDESGVRKILGCAELFGLGSDTHSVYPVDGISFSRTTSFPSSLNNVDVLIMSYDASGKSISNNEQNMLLNFVNIDKGVLIQCLENGNSLNITNNIFESTIISSRNQTRATDCAATLLPGNQIVNGMYMDLGNKKIGYDGGYNLSFNISDFTNVEVIATRDCDNEATILKHKSKPYILLGDGGILCSENARTSTNNSPLLVDSNGLPEVKTHAPYSTPVYNSHLFENIMLWAINYRISVKP